MKARTLYLTYDGLTDPLGQSQVLPYLEGLARRGHAITLVSCEKPAAFRVRGAMVRAQCAAAGIEWHPLRYRKRPPVLSTLLDLAVMRRTAFKLHRRQAFDLIHCRSYLPGLIGLIMRRETGARFLFDMRGFWIDERFERGIWPTEHPLYKRIAAFLRVAERQFFLEADAIVSLTDAALPRIAAIAGPDSAKRTTVIPCCVDLTHFDPLGGSKRREGRTMLGLAEETPLMVTVGSVGGAYPLAPVTALFRAWADEREDARLLFVTRHPPGEILGDPAIAGIAGQVIVRSAGRDEVPALLAAGDCGASIILASPAAVASSPTKLGEMLGMDLPVIANAGIGDTERILGGSGAGAVMADLSQGEIERCAAAARRLPASPRAPRRLAQQWFDLSSGVARYDAIYRGLAAES